VNVASTKVQEGTGPGTDRVAVYLSRPDASTVTTYLSALGSATGQVGQAMDPVTFRPGQTCQVVTVPSQGNTAPSATPTTAYTIAVSDPDNAVLGTSDFGTVTVAANAVTTGTVAPADGVQGNPCDELAALSHPGKLSVAGHGNVTAGSAVTVTGNGYRDGESVAFSLGGTAVGSAIADASGSVSFQLTIPAAQATGHVTVSAVGAGSGYTSSAQLTVTR
jgi:hypothetical protein